MTNDLIGQRFGKLLVIKRLAPNKNKNYTWECICDCGNTTVVSGGSLIGGTTKSCGCLQKELTGNRVRFKYGEAAFNIVFNDYVRGAKRREIDFKLSKEEFRKITQEKCFYCGKEPSQEGTKNKNRNGYYIYNGIDRIDSSVGYTISNVVPCCKICNYAKSTHSQKDFIEWIRSVYNYLKLENHKKNK
jgi:hypothetical protein